MNVTNHPGAPSVRSDNEGAFDEYVSYCALGGLVTEDDGRPRKMSVTEFCETYGVTKMTLIRWKKIPGFIEKVDRRRAEIMPLARVSAVWNANYVASVQTKDLRAAVEAQKVFLGHFGNLVTPVQRAQVELKHTAADLLTAAKQDGIIEGEIVDGAATAEPNTAD